MRTTFAMVGVPAVVMLLARYVVLDRLLTFASPADKMMWAGARRASLPRASAIAISEGDAPPRPRCAGVAALCSVQVVVIVFLCAAFRDDDGDDAGGEKKKA